ncbi:MAG: NAD(P)-binding protein [Caldilineaceae bacterium]
MEKTQKKVKVAILGGGIAAITAAYELTNTQELRDQYDVTIYQLGWRIGGKGASGRNPAHCYRIEEHGLHVWFGFYENAFQIMQRCYAELGRSATQPLATWRDAFKPCNDIVLCDNYAGQWHPIQFAMPKPSDGDPGQGKILPNFWQMASMALQWAWDFWKMLWHKYPTIQNVAKLSDMWVKPSWWQHAINQVEVERTEVEKYGKLSALYVALQMARQRSKAPIKVGATEDYPHFCALLEIARDALWKLWAAVGEWLPDQTQLRVLVQLFDTGSTILCGILNDNLIERGFDVINDLEFSDWLAQHGAHPQTLQEGLLVRGVYDMAFAYLYGRQDMRNFAAGTGVRALLRLLLTYQGAFAWKMQAGMGDTVFTPFYQVLKQAPRNVKFKFFHAVSNLGLSADKKMIETITMIPQVALKKAKDDPAAEYDPLIEVNQLACWPSEPCWDQLEIDEATRTRLAQEGKTFENTLNPLELAPLTLRKGQDFDLIVLGIPVAALKPICQELYADEQNPRFKQMLDDARTVITQSFQLWLNQDLNTALGWRFAANSMLCSYVEPLDTYSNMTHLLPRECWPSDANVKDIAYFCGVFPENLPGEKGAEYTEQVKKNGINFLNGSVQRLWPHSVVNAGFNWNLLVDLANKQGEQRFDAQFWRVNDALSERYVLTPAKLVNSRLRTDEAGYANLYLAGDWIKTGMDAGCIEATVMAGMQAARAICGSPATIFAEKDNWL